MQPTSTSQPPSSQTTVRDQSSAPEADARTTDDFLVRLREAERAIQECLGSCDPALKTDQVRRTEEVELTVVMPCLNEADTLATCIEKALRAMREHGITGEVVVADNGSTDGSVEIATELGARIVSVSETGYGSALMGGIHKARGRLIVMGDADDSYDFSDIPMFVEALRDGNDLVMGNRFRGGIEKGAMPLLHKYLGNPVLTGIGRIFFRSACGDFHCGLRGFSAEAIQKLDLQSTGMEFASEMVVKSTLQGLRIAEIPTTLSPDGRSRPPHLRSFRDGWRHLRFMLLYSPRWLFLIPGLLAISIGLLGYGLALPAVTMAGITFGVHTLLVASLAILLGTQLVQFALYAKLYAISAGLLPPDRRVERFFQLINLEHGLLLGGASFTLGMGLLMAATNQWWHVQFGQLEFTTTMRWVIPGVTLASLGFQTIFSSFFISILRMSRQ